MILQQRLAKRFADIEALSTEIGKKGMQRMAFTEAEEKVKAYLSDILQALNLQIMQDAFGNIIARKEGKNPDLPVILIASHTDSVPNGGNYDGMLGILVGIEVLESFQEEGIALDHPVELLLFTCEESSRFGAATLGSRAMRGELSVDNLQSYKEKSGKSLYEVLQERGLQPEAIASATYTKPAKAFFEVHIEQGKVLETEKLSIGIVSGIAAARRFKIHLHGQADHSGATPMHMRKDGLCTAAEIILAVEDICGRRMEAPLVGTVGICEVTPGVTNVIPGEVLLGFDVRSISQSVKEFAAEQILKQVKKICERRGISYDYEPISNEHPMMMKEEMVNFFKEVCEDMAMPHMVLPSGAGHDAMHWGDYVPTGMLFIPCREGISHNPEESAEIEDIVKVTEVLAEVLKRVGKVDFKF